ncbi:MAG: hypothetical protein JXI32_01875 [Deltaproteobacteria bacterium]|nr:hypothetical protein [Deltaproteobacteria bacterium]
MPTAKNAKLQIEGGRTFHDFAAMTNSGDQTVFTISGGGVFSGKSGYEPVVRPDGVVTGRNVLSPHADDNKVTVAAFTCYLAGVLKEISATTATITRPSSDVAHVTSITVDNTGAIAVVEGTDGTGATFSEERGANGGPPYIPVGSIEIGQVRVTAAASAAIAATEIFQAVGQHVERSDYPIFAVSNLGDGLSASVSAKKNAHVEFASALPASHTGDLAKGVYIQFYAPTLQDLGKVFDFVPCEMSHSVSSKEYYRGSIASVSESLGQGSYTALMSDNIQDLLVTEKNEILTHKFFPDENKAAYSLTQGKVGLKRSFPAADQIQAVVTLSAESQSVEFDS